MANKLTLTVAQKMELLQIAVKNSHDTEDLKKEYKGMLDLITNDSISNTTNDHKNPRELEVEILECKATLYRLKADSIKAELLNRQTRGGP